MNLGRVIQSLREEKGMHQKELAEKINISYSVMNRIESGERPARDEEIKRIADVLEVSTDYLLGRTSVRNNTEKISSALSEDKELLQFWDELRGREELQVLFKQTKELDKGTINQIIRIIKAIEDEESQV